VQLSQTFRQCCRTRLKDKRRLHFVDVIVADSTNAIPTVALANPFLLHRATTPGTDNDFGIAANHFGGIDDSIPGRLLLAQLGKDTFATCGINEFIYPANTGDERVVPLFEKDSRR